MLEYNLQFYAKEGPGGEKTEEPTTKKLEDARKEGQVAKSKEIYNGLGLLLFFLVIKFMGGYLGTRFLQTFSYVYNRFSSFTTLHGGRIETGEYVIFLREMLGRVLLIILPILLASAVLAFVTDVVQVKWKVTGKPLKPKFSKLNPLKGFKRIFSAKSLIELLKSVVKIALVGYIAYTTVMGQLRQFNFLYDLSVPQAIAWLGKTITDLGIKITAFYMIIAAVDFLYEKRKFHNDMKMTKQEVKDEYKNAEGDPQVKNKQKRRMMEASMRRMMQEVPKADVVITNPTHFAVAIKYDTELAAAPYVVAKGEDQLALRIKEVAKEHNVPIMENKPLARALYHNVEVGSMIPQELYQGVAEVLAAVYHAQGKI